MGYTTIRISESARDTLRQLATQAERPMQSVLEDAIELLRRQRFLEQVNAAYGSLRADPKRWQDVEAERKVWDVTIGDGLSVAEPRAKYRSPKKRKAAR
jgi:predicted transcriptional regulator